MVVVGLADGYQVSRSGSAAVSLSYGAWPEAGGGEPEAAAPAAAAQLRLVSLGESGAPAPPADFNVSLELDEEWEAVRAVPRRSPRSSRGSPAGDTGSSLLDGLSPRSSGSRRTSGSPSL